MASHTLPIPFLQRQARVRLAVSARLPSLRTGLLIIIAVLILFRWLNLFLALDITRTGRQIQADSRELGRIERDNALLRLGIAQAESPPILSAEARKLGYQPRKPIYVPLDAAISGPQGAIESVALASGSGNETEIRSDPETSGGW